MTCARSDALTWDEYFMSIAHISAHRSKDPSRQVGCCIVETETNKIISIGYNGFPRGCQDSDLPWDKTGDWFDTKYPYVVHAEANAIVNATTSLKNSIAYVTLYPCNECAKLLIQAGITKIVYDIETQTEAKKAADRMFNLSSIEIVKLVMNKRFVLQ
jgi:dCMP deaminase